MTIDKRALSAFKQAVAEKSKEPVSESVKKSALAKLVKAQEKFLLECGWRREGKHWITDEKRVGHAFKGDKLFLEAALSAQLQDLDPNAWTH